MRKPTFVVITLILLACTAGGFLFHRRAVRAVTQFDPKIIGNAYGTTFFAQPRRLRVGQKLADIVAHLKGIGFVESPTGERGTFLHDRSAHRLDIRARSVSFKNLAVTIGKRGEIAAIQAEGVPVESAEIEGETLGDVIRMLRDGGERAMSVRRIVLSSEQVVPSVLYDAVRASEDADFERHHGISYKGIARSIVLRRGGGSTLTQQLVKNTILRDATKSPWRKIAEINLALAMEDRLSKDEIFTAYANNVFLGAWEGGNLYGFAAAGEAFFGIADPRTLSAAQAATLAGMLDRPQVYLREWNAGNPKPLTDRRNLVLDRMAKVFPDRYAAALDAARSEPVAFVAPAAAEPPLDLISRHFQQFAAREAGKLTDRPMENLQVVTTMDADLQAAAHHSLARAFERLDPLVDRECRRQKVGPRFDGEANEGDYRINGAVVALDPLTGEVLAMAGGRTGVNCAADIKRSPGSVNKVFAYLEAVKSGTMNGQPVTPATWIDPGDSGGGPATARRHFATSDNAAALRVGEAAGLGAVADTIARLTGSRPAGIDGMLVLGGSAGCEVSPLAVAEAMSIFAGGGCRATATPFRSVSANGQAISVPRPERVRTEDPAAVYVTARMMEGVLEPGGTAAAAAVPGVAVAGKTGTGQTADFWFVATTPRLVVVVWLGMPLNRPALSMDRGFKAGTVAVPVFRDFIEAVRRSRPDLLAAGRDFPRPENVVDLRVNDRGERDESGTPMSFVRGREPR